MGWDPYSITLRDGGGTFHVEDDGTITHVEFDSGFTVGAIDGTGVVIRLDSGTAHPLELVRQSILWLHYHYEAEYVGTWLDDHMLYIDPVKVLRTKAGALSSARSTRQKAIYDNAKQEVISL